MIRGTELLEEYEEIDWFRTSNEIQFTTMVAVIGRWRQRSTEDFHVFHDNSSNFMRQRADWNAITNPDVNPRLHPLGDGTFVPFPLRVLSTTSVDSAGNYAIQLCDILSGVSARYFKLVLGGNTTDPLIGILQETALDQLPHTGLMFEPIFPEDGPALATGLDAADQFTQILREQRE